MLGYVEGNRGESFFDLDEFHPDGNPGKNLQGCSAVAERKQLRSPSVGKYEALGSGLSDAVTRKKLCTAVIAMAGPGF
ncbi:hypothetical protein ACFO7V_09820 [Glutamicibacter bergerei]|uniref:Uncharacterized protein n=1 Tax=Glutamicibacter bergerei TaxID=256702 RepID=A0ABV9MKG5_9MICC|nr:hypothetical protein [Micrococcaceae bacterium]